jgi:hypothetical protein
MTGVLRKKLDLGGIDLAVREQRCHDMMSA